MPGIFTNDTLQDYLEKYKKYLNLKRDAVLQKHGSQYSVNSLGIGQPKVSPSTANAPLALNWGG